MLNSYYLYMFRKYLRSGIYSFLEIEECHFLISWNFHLFNSKRQVVGIIKIIIFLQVFLLLYIFCLYFTFIMSFYKCRCSLFRIFFMELQLKVWLSYSIWEHN